MNLNKKERVIVDINYVRQKVFGCLTQQGIRSGSMSLDSFGSQILLLLRSRSVSVIKPDRSSTFFKRFLQRSMGS